MEMTKVVGIRFKPAGKIYDFDSGAFVLKQGDHVIVETEQGINMGVVAVAPTPVERSPDDPALTKIYRLATEKDFDQHQKNLEVEKNAYRYCQQYIRELSLNMNLFAVESSFDASKLTFFFTSEGRVDFRQLVKMLVKQLSVRVEMRQVGIRNQAKICGGLGRCGRGVCCSTWLEKFEPVSIRMAKDQSLSLNPTKISGLCGRLMCCLTFENDTYLALKEHFPKFGKSVATRSGKGKIVRHNVLKDQVVVRLEDGSEIEVPLAEITTEEKVQSPREGD